MFGTASALAVVAGSLFLWWDRIRDRPDEQSSAAEGEAAECSSEPVSPTNRTVF